jgi:hypothetical protein
MTVLRAKFLRIVKFDFSMEMERVVFQRGCTRHVCYVVQDKRVELRREQCWTCGKIIKK